jgi:hypothetical protein
MLLDQVVRMSEKRASMHPLIRRGPSLLRQVDHVHGGSVASLAGRPAFQRCFTFPKRLVSGRMKPVHYDRRKLDAWLQRGVERSVLLSLNPGVICKGAGP